MCARVTLTLSASMIKKVLIDNYNVKQFTIDDYLPRYNISPGEKVLSIITDGTINKTGYLDWKFSPPWSTNDNDGYKFINARSETIFEKPTFKKSFMQKRCLIIVDSFFEWKKEGKEKIPFRFYRENNEIFTLAGIWTVNTNKSPEGKKTYGLSVITTEANNLMKPIHSRMPVIIKPDDVSKWLDIKTPVEELIRLMKPVEDDFLAFYQVSSYVNSSKNKGIKCIEQI